MSWREVFTRLLREPSVQWTYERIPPARTHIGEEEDLIYRSVVIGGNYPR